METDMETDLEETEVDLQDVIEKLKRGEPISKDNDDSQEVLAIL